MHSGLLEYKQVLRPCRLVAFDAKKNTVTLKNHRYFTALTDLDLYWTVERNGRVVREGRILSLNIAPQHRRTYRLDLGNIEELDGYCYLNLSFRQNTTHPWAATGYEVGFEQVELCAKLQAVPAVQPSRDAIDVVETARELRLTDGETTYTVSKKTGLVTGITGYGKPLLTAPIAPTVWRAPTDNDRKVKRDWMDRFYHKQKSDCRGCRITERSDGRVSVESDLILAADCKQPLLRMTVTYTVARGQGLTLSVHAETRLEHGVPLPRFGFVYRMPSECEYLSYFGRGPVESYRDKCQASRIGHFATTVTEHFEPYVRPQENMAHTQTRWMRVADPAGLSLLVLNTEQSDTFSFNCSHFTAEQLTETAHDYELEPLADTVVYVDYMQAGIGSNSCGPTLWEDLQLKPEQIDFAFRLLPGRADDVCPFEQLK